VKLVYLTNARLPTEKAHGYQICKMCEAFVQNGVEVVSMHPSRRQPHPGLRGQSVFDYYGIKRSFAVRTLPNLDVVVLNRFISDRFFTPIFFAHALLWGLYAALLARREKADFYYTRDSDIAYWLAWLGLPTVYEAHVVPKRAQRLLLRRVARSPALQIVVTLTSFIREGLVRLAFPSEKMIVLPDGVDLLPFENLPSKEECRARLTLPQDSAIIGYIGRFRSMEMEKGIPELVKAMALMPSVDGQELLLLCVGGPMGPVPGYLRLAEKLGVRTARLKFIDRVPNAEVPYWIRAGDVVTIPWPWTEFSAYFTSPLKLFEYMAAGVPIVASDLPSLREVLEHRDNAWLVKPGDAKALAEAINNVLTDPKSSAAMAARAREKVIDFTWTRRAQKIVRLLSDTGKCRNLYPSV